MNSRQMYVWLLLFFLLMVLAGTGCHSSLNGPSHAARKAKAPHPPAAGEGGTAGASGTDAGEAARTDGRPTMGGTATAGGSSGDANYSATVTGDIAGDILRRKSGGGGRPPVVHARPPEQEQQQEQQQQQPPAQVSNPDTSRPPQKRARKEYETLVSETVPPDPDQVLQTAVDSLPVGKVVFSHPTEMKMGEAREVQVRISRDVAADLASGLTPSETDGKDQITEQQQIKVSTSMKVQLHGEPYFDVKPLTDEEQLIDKAGFTEWKFTVIPLQGGKWPLHLTVTAVVHAADREKVKNLEVLDEQVTVQVSTLEVVQAFIGNNWQWLIGTIFIPIGAWLLPKLRKKKGQAQAA